MLNPDFTDILSAFIDEKVEFLVVGGYAMAFHGYVRATGDIDLWIRKPSPKNYLIEYCNLSREELRTEFYIVAPVSPIPKCEENLEAPTNTVLGESVDFYDSKIEFTPLENIVIEHGVLDGVYSDVSIDRLKKSLNDFPPSKVYLISYLQTNFKQDENGKIISGGAKKPDKKSLAARMLRAAQKELVGKGFSASQIETIDGGYVNDTRRLEFWFIPQGGEIPQPKPDYFPKKIVKKR